MTLDATIAAAQQQRIQEIERRQHQFAKRLRRIIGNDLYQQLDLQICYGSPGMFREEEAYATFCYQGVTYQLTDSGQRLWYVQNAKVPLTKHRGQAIWQRKLRRELVAFLAEQTKP